MNTSTEIQSKVEEAFTAVDNRGVAERLIMSLVKAGELEVVLAIALSGNDDPFFLTDEAQTEYAKHADATTENLDRVYQAVINNDNELAIIALYTNSNSSAALKREIAYHFHEELDFHLS